MKEIEFEKNTIHLGTVKKKADLIKSTSLTPAQVNGAIKRMGEKLPTELKRAEQFALELFDFLADEEHQVFEESSDENIREDLVDYIAGQVWESKHKARTIKTPEFQVFMDGRKLFKDHRTAQAMLINRSLKNHEIGDRDDLRVAFQEELEALEENILEDYFIENGLLPAPKTKELSDSQPDQEQLPESQ